MSREFTIRIKDYSKIESFLAFMQELDFVEIHPEMKRKRKKFSLLSSAGIWKDRTINSHELRISAWKKAI